MTLTPALCRAARALLGWSQQELERMSRVAKKTIADFERGARNPFPRTLADIVEALENAGVEFTEGVENNFGPGVRFKLGFDDPGITAAGNTQSAQQGSDGLLSAPWDDGFEQANFDEFNLSDDERQWLHYVRTNPKLSERGREILLKTIRIYM